MKKPPNVAQIQTMFHHFFSPGSRPIPRRALNPEKPHFSSKTRNYDDESCTYNSVLSAYIVRSYSCSIPAVGLQYSFRNTSLYPKKGHSSPLMLYGFRQDFGRQSTQKIKNRRALKRPGPNQKIQFYNILLLECYKNIAGILQKYWMHCVENLQ